MTDRSIGSVRDYYERTVSGHPPGSPRAVDWGSPDAQMLRLQVLLSAMEAMGPQSVCDLGCGLGALLQVIRNAGHDWAYVGIDLAPSMIALADARAPGGGPATFAVGRTPGQADVVVGSGIFNVRPGVTDEDWRRHVDATLGAMVRSARVGVVTNFLPPVTPGHTPASHLHYEDPERVSALVRSLGCRVETLSDYGPFDFTLVAWKELAP